MTRITAALALACIAGSALAQQTITVPDDYPTLGLALNPAVSGLMSGDSIVLKDTVSYAGTFTITTPGITIREAPGNDVVIDAFGTGSVLTVNIGSGSLTLEGLTIQNGAEIINVDNGGGVQVLGAGLVTLRDCIVRDNQAEVGGGMAAENTSLVIENCSFSDNTADLFAGAIRSSGNSSMTVSITGSTFTGNSALGGNGGAIDHAGSGASLTITDSTFSMNTCTVTGAGVFATQADNATIINVDFLDNISLGTISQDTGGLYLNVVGYAVVEGCDFERNLCAGSGGGMRFNNTAGDVIDCRFTQNEASNGGAIQVVGSSARADIYNCVFDGNSARRTGNDSASGAGAIMANSSGIVNIYNSLFIHNTATTGGAISSATDAEVRIYNSTFSANDADSVGGAIRRLNIDAIVFANSCIFYGNLPTGSQIAINGTGNNDEVNFSLVEGGYTQPGVGNIDADPMFVDASGGDYSLMPGSPAIDAGSSSRYIGGPLSDLAGNNRGQDDPDTADLGEAIIGAVIDIGAFEFSPGVMVSCPADQNFNGTLEPGDFTAWIANYNAGCN